MLARKRFDKFACVPSDGAFGGLVIWSSRVFDGTVLVQDYCGLVITFRSLHSQDSFVLANIYGPCTCSGREDFIVWLCHLEIDDNNMWLLVGDFNFYRSVENRN